MAARKKPAEAPRPDSQVSLAGMVVLPEDMYERMFKEAVVFRLYLHDYERTFGAIRGLVTSVVSSVHPKSSTLESYLSAWDEVEDFPRDLDKFQGLLAVFMGAVIRHIKDPSSGFMDSLAELSERGDFTKYH